MDRQAARVSSPPLVGCTFRTPVLLARTLSKFSSRSPISAWGGSGFSQTHRRDQSSDPIEVHNRWRKCRAEARAAISRTTTSLGLYYWRAHTMFCNVGVRCFWAVALLGLLAGTAGAVDIETVPVGNPGNTADPNYGGYGAVGYDYRIGNKTGSTCFFCNTMRNYPAKI